MPHIFDPFNLDPVTTEVLHQKTSSNLPLHNPKTNQNQSNLKFTHSLTQLKMTEITKQYEQDIRDYAQVSEPKIAEAGRMGELMLWKISSKSSRDSLISSIYYKVKRLADSVEWGLTIDIPKAREELEKEIARAS